MSLSNEHLELGTVHWCRRCCGYTSGNKSCDVCATFRKEPKDLESFKKLERITLEDALKGVYFSGETVRFQVWSGWDILTVWHFNEGGIVLVPSTCQLIDKELYSSFQPFKDAAWGKPFDVYRYLGEYLASVTVESPYWSRVDRSTGQVLDIFERDLTGSIEGEATYCFEEKSKFWDDYFSNSPNPF